MFDIGSHEIIEMFERQSIYNPPIEYRLSTDVEDGLLPKTLAIYQAVDMSFLTEEYYEFEGIHSTQLDQPNPEYMEFGVEVQMDKDKAREKHVQEVYDSIGAEDISEVNFEEFIEYCENKYQMKTDIFKQWFEAKGNEGNVELQMWYMFSLNIGDQE